MAVLALVFDDAEGSTDLDWFGGGSSAWVPLDAADGSTVVDPWTTRGRMLMQPDNADGSTEVTLVELTGLRPLMLDAAEGVSDSTWDTGAEISDNPAIGLVMGLSGNIFISDSEAEDD